MDGWISGWLDLAGFAPIRTYTEWVEVNMQRAKQLTQMLISLLLSRAFKAQTI